MAGNMAAKRKSSATPQKRRHRLPWRIAVPVAAALVALAGLLFGPKLLAARARYQAARDLNVWAIGAAQHRLARAAWFDAADAQTHLLQAICYRRLEQMDRFSVALQLAQSNGIPASAVERETKLAMVQAGEFYTGAERELIALIDSGAAAHDVGTTFLKGYLSRNDGDRARMLLETWQSEFPDEPHAAYMWALYRQWQGDRELAEAELEKALAGQPRHDLARAALAKSLELQDRLQDALAHYLEWTMFSLDSQDARLGLAGVLRKLNRFEQARSILEFLADQPETRSLALTEMARVEFESGSYTAASRSFQQLRLHDSSDSALLMVIGTSLAIGGDPGRAEPFFVRAAALDDRVARGYDLRAKLALDPGNRELGSQLDELNTPLTSRGGQESWGTATDRVDGNADPVRKATGLHATHCAACHGADGNGQGPATRHLFPKPRDFRNEKFRLVSTQNGAPTTADLETILLRGIPGTAMRAYDDLSEEDRALLVEEVMRLFRDGLRNQYVTLLENEGEEIDEQEVGLMVAECSTPGEVVKAPHIGDFNEQVISRGRKLYDSLGCNNCHGDNGVGAWNVWLFDDTGLPSRPRDLVHEPFKGGPDSESVYLRIALGMPGTPHPASYGIREEQLIDLVQYCRSLSAEPARNLTNFERVALATGDAYLAEFGDSTVP
jgi:tetratricopeptide (TPR) repeat protein